MTYLTRHLFLLVNIKISEHKLQLSPLFYVLTPSLKQLPQSVLNTIGGTLINFQKKFPPPRLINPPRNFPTPTTIKTPTCIKHPRGDSIDGIYPLQLPSLKIRELKTDSTSSPPYGFSLFPSVMQRYRHMY